MRTVSIDLNMSCIEGLSDSEIKKLSTMVQNTLVATERKISDNKLDFELLKNYYNQVFTKAMRVVTDKTKTNLNKRIKEGYTKNDIQKVIDNASNDKFHEPNDFKHVTLEFLSRADIFSRYVSEKEHQVPRNKKLSQKQKGHTNY